MMKTSEKTILYVDKKHSVRDMMIDYLSLSLGYQCFPASTIEEAKIILNTPDIFIDLLITDASWADGKCLELLDWCEAHDLHFPVIALSRSCDQLDGLGLYSSEVLQKPIDLDHMMAAIERAFESSETVELERLSRRISISNYIHHFQG